jgi:hypothetical protein
MGGWMCREENVFNYAFLWTLQWDNFLQMLPGPFPSLVGKICAARAIRLAE